MSLIVFYGNWLSLTVSTSVMELLHVFHCLPLLLAVYKCLFQLHAVAACLQPSHIGAGCLSLSLLVPWSCSMSPTVSYFS